MPNDTPPSAVAALPAPVPEGGPQRHLPALDGLRGVAVLLVFFYHYAGGAQSHNPLLRAFGLVNKAGWCGVTLFFVLSGFLITGILLNSFGRPGAARNFYMRRVLRIVPLYFLVIVIVLGASAWQHALGPGSRLALTLATFTQNLPSSQRHGSVPAPVFHLWSIATEEQFYLLWPPLLFLVYRSRQRAWLPAGLFAASLGYRVFLWHGSADPVLYAQTLPVRGGELAAGCALALLWRSACWPRWASCAAPGAWLFAAVFAWVSLAAGSAQLGSPAQWVWGLTAMTLCLVCSTAVALGGGRFARLLSMRPLPAIGRVSYGIYVYHFLLLHYVNRAAAALVHARNGTVYDVVRLLVAALFTAIASVASYRWLEEPFLRLKRYFPAGVTVMIKPL